MITEIENKSMIGEPDVATLRERVAALRSQESRHELELHAANSAASGCDTDITLAQGNKDAKALTTALIAHGGAQSRILAAVENLTTTRGRLNQATSELLHAEGLLAAAEAAVLEKQIVSELQDFAGNMSRYLHQCLRIQDLRSRAQINQHLLTPAVLEGLGPNWGEILSPGSVESRLLVIGKCAALPHEAASIVRTAAVERSRVEQAETERVRRSEAERNRSRRVNLNAGEPFTTVVENGTIVYKRLDDPHIVR